MPRKYAVFVVNVFELVATFGFIFWSKLHLLGGLAEHLGRIFSVEKRIGAPMSAKGRSRDVRKK